MIELNQNHLLTTNPTFGERITKLGTSGRCFNLDERPHLLVAEGRRLVPFDTPEKLAGALLFGGDVQIVSVLEGTPVTHQKHTIQMLARALGAFLANNPYAWPNLRTYVNGPMYRRTAGGRMARVPNGYDPDTKQLVLAPDLPGIPAVAEGYPHLHALFSGLEFADPVYRANLLGVCVALFCRTGIDQFPLLLIDATAKSSGKTTVLNTMGCLLNGAPANSVPYSGSEEEFERRLGSFCGLPGPNFIPIDNVRGKKGGNYMIRSQALSMAVHSHVSKVRKMHVGPAMLFDPIFVCTMNDAKVERDLADKCVALTLTRPPGPDNNRKIVPYPPDYVRQWRMELLAEIFQVIERLQLSPIEGTRFHTRFYDFEQIVTGAARELGLEASFDPTRVRTVDAFVEQLLNLIHDTDLIVDGKVSVERLVNQVGANRGFDELDDVLRSTNRAGKGRAAAFTDHLANTVSGKRYKWHGKIISLTIDNSTLTLHNLD